MRDMAEYKSFDRPWGLMEWWQAFRTIVVLAWREKVLGKRYDE